MLLQNEIHTEDLGPKKMMDNFVVFGKGSKKVMQVFNECKAFTGQSYDGARTIVKVWGLGQWALYDLIFKSVRDWEELYLTFNEAYGEVTQTEGVNRAGRCAKGGNLIGTQMNKIFNSDKGLTDFVWTHGPAMLEGAHNMTTQASEATKEAIEAAQKSFTNYSKLAQDKLDQAKETIGEERIQSAKGFGRSLIEAGHHIGSKMTYENYDYAKNYTIDAANSLYSLGASYAIKAQTFMSTSTPAE